jgi:phage portal protein BeeE
MNKYNFNELDFVQSSKEQEAAILKALGVPPILLDSGNNANISPNLRMFYINTVLPLVTKVTQSFERYFGYDLKPVTQDVLALQPELRELANFHSTLVNAGIITRNESRAKLRYPYSDSEIADELVLPANVAGSAASANLGGKPIEEQE